MDNNSILKKLLYAAVWMLSAALSICLLVVVLTSAGRPSAKFSDMKLAVSDRYQMALLRDFSYVIEDGDEAPTLQSAGNAKYWIGKDARVAPKPNQELYGSSRDPMVLQSVVDGAAELLDGQSLFFDPNVELYGESEVLYYSDETILSLTWKQNVNNGVYTFTEVKIAHPSQFRRFLSGGEFGSGTLYLPSEMAVSVNAVSASSADFYNFRQFGITVVDGKLCRNITGLNDICYISEDGDLLLETGQNDITDEQLEAYIKEHKINFSLAFGPILVKDSVVIETPIYPIGEVFDNVARAALLQMGPLHYIVVNANVEWGTWHWPDLFEFRAFIGNMGCLQAYTIDGGQTATTVVNNKVINEVSHGSERYMSDIIYFATAIPDGG